MDGRILVVEDCTEVIQGVAHLFSQWGFEVEIAWTVDEAIKVLRRVHVDGLTLGIMDVVRYLREAKQKMPVIIVSAHVPDLQKNKPNSRKPDR